ncbi:hypothetical protein [Stygiolobus azoricus]|uniref:hypothetical protein n=1 Tax=Stygiolobus azoricus TaxID=41675 RepID=UPI0012DE03DD|nr:hypothetical protein [Stygiolobus azoricus]
MDWSISPTKSNYDVKIFSHKYIFVEINEVRHRHNVISEKIARASPEERSSY